MRISKGWQGRKPALLASTGFLVVLVCYLGVNFLGIGCIVMDGYLGDF